MENFIFYTVLTFLTSSKFYLRKPIYQNLLVLKSEKNCTVVSFSYDFCIFHEFMFNMVTSDRSSRRVTRGGGGGVGMGRSPCPFSKIGKKCPNFWGKCSDCGHLWVKFLI